MASITVTQTRVRAARWVQSLKGGVAARETAVLQDAEQSPRAKVFCASADLRAAMKKAEVTGKLEMSLFADS